MDLSRTWFVLVIIEALTIASIIIAVSSTSPKLVTGTYTTRQHTAYVTVTTIVASILTASIASAMQNLWIQRIDCQFQPKLQAGELLEINRKWRVALRIANPAEVVHHIPIPLTYLVTSLITAAIVASFTPSLGTQITSYTVQIPDGQPYGCASIYSNTFYNWTLSNGSMLGIPANAPGCPHRYALTLMGMINTDDANITAYADSGVAVQPSAIGASIGVYSSSFQGLGGDISQILSKYGTGVLSTTSCVPVMVRNPISCRFGGLTKTDNISISVYSDNGLCNSTMTVAVRDGDSQINVFCPHGLVGQGTMAFGATGAYTTWFARTIDPTSNWPSLTGSTLAITCDVNTRNVYEYRTVVFNLQPDSSQSPYARILSAGGPCDPLVYGTVNSIDDTLFAISATGNWQALSQNQYWDGLPDSIGRATFTTPFEVRIGPWAFNNSKNALEDVLGLTAALVASRINSTTTSMRGEASILVTQIGGGKPYGYAYAVIPLLSFCILVILMIMTQRASEVKHRTSKLQDLVQAGNAPIQNDSLKPECWAYTYSTPSDNGRISEGKSGG